MTPTAGRAIAWLSFALGIAVSIAGNILHSALTPAGLGELVGAAFWPTALMLSIEILTRVRWQNGGWWMTARVVGLFLVGVVAAVLSYRHLAGLMTSWGEDIFNAHLGPLAVDGLMLLAATALLSISKEPKDDAEPVAVDSVSRIVVLNPWDLLHTDKPIGQITSITEEPGGSLRMTAKAMRADVQMPRDGVKWEAQGEGWTQGPTPEQRQEDFELMRDAVVGTETLPEAVEKSRLHIVDHVSEDDAVEAVRQAYIQSLDTGKPLSAQQVAERLKISKSTAHRKYTTQWARERRIIRS